LEDGETISSTTPIKNVEDGFSVGTQGDEATDESELIIEIDGSEEGGDDTPLIIEE